MKEENGPLIALIVFVVFSILFGVMAYLNHSALIGDPERPQEQPSKDSQIKEYKTQLDDLQLEIAKCNLEIAQLSVSIKEQNSLYQYWADVYDSFRGEYQRRMMLLKMAESFDKQASDLQNAIAQLKQGTLATITKQSTVLRDDMERDVQVRNTAKDAAQTRKKQVGDEFEAEKKRHHGNKNYSDAELVNAKAILSDLTQRDAERAKVLKEADGKVLLSDPVTRFVVIDIGTAAGVRNGFRFEVYEPLAGGGKRTKGYLEVIKADPGKSQCLVLSRPVEMPRDPLSGYVAREPEEMYSPYFESGRKGSSAQPLSGSPLVVSSGPGVVNPIIEGDLIQNPFFSPDRSYTFYIAGAKRIENDRQKSAIRYRWTDIKAMVEFYGGKVSATADPSVNYMIAQKNPESEGEDAEKAEFKRAKELGLPVIYEWELFRFLDRK